MARTSILAALCCVLLLVVEAQGLFFYLKEGQSKCFIEDLPASTLVVGEFAGSDIEATPTGEHQPRKDAAAQPLALSVVVKEPDGGILVDNIYPASGRVAFTSRIAGEHVVCFKTSSTRWFGAGSVVRSPHTHTHTPCFPSSPLDCTYHLPPSPLFSV